MNNLEKKYQTEAVPKMMERFGYKNKMAVPRIDKVTLNVGFGKMISGKDSKEQEKIQESILKDLGMIAGQRPVKTLAKKAISAFKVRQGQPVGAKVTLRRGKMSDFLERLVNVALPRTRDFQGIGRESFDEKGNLAIGVKEHTAFPEISPEQVKMNFGFEVVVSTTAESREEGAELLKLLGFPIKS